MNTLTKFDALFEIRVSKNIMVLPDDIDIMYRPGSQERFTSISSPAERMMLRVNVEKSKYMKSSRNETASKESTISNTEEL